MSKRTMRWVGLTGLMMAGLALAGALTSADSGSKSTDFWSSFRPIGAQEVESYNSLREMALASDAVVTGKIQSVKLGRYIEDESGDRIYFANVTLKVDSVKKESPGAAAQGDKKYVIEMPILGAAADEAQRTNKLPKLDLPMEDGVYFLRLKADGGASGLYRPVNLSGIWVSDASGSRAPLAEADETDRMSDSASARAATSAESLARIAVEG